MLWVLGALGSLIGVGYLFDKEVAPKIGAMTDKNTHKKEHDAKKAPPPPPDGLGWWWLLIIGGPLGILAGVYFFFFRKKDPKGRALYNMGYMGVDVPDDLKKNESYLAGMAKRLRDDKRDEKLSQLGAKLGGLDVKHITAEYGKKSYYPQQGGNYYGNSKY